MRTLSTILVIVLLLGGGSLISNRHIQTTTQIMANHLESVTQSISTEKWDEARNELKNAQKSWIKTNSWWSILLDHEEIDTIDLSIRRLERYIETQDVTLSLGEVSALEFLFEHISAAEQCTLENIL